MTAKPWLRVRTLKFGALSLKKSAIVHGTTKIEPITHDRQSKHENHM
jgi:hypothetical protein